MFKYTGSVTNDETFYETFEIVTPGVDITNWDIEFILGDKSATVTKGTLISTAGSPASFTVTLPLSSMQQFCAGTKPVGCRYTENGITSQIIVGTCNIIEGNFTP